MNSFLLALRRCLHSLFTALLLSAMAQAAEPVVDAAAVLAEPADETAAEPPLEPAQDAVLAPADDGVAPADDGEAEPIAEQTADPADDPPPEPAAEPGAEPVQNTERHRQQQSFERAIAELEARQGAYSPELAESLLGLALNLQSRQEHAQAIALFKRSVHLARVNGGLYSSAQIPSLQGEITSLVALGQYLEADDRQRYLYRVQLRAPADDQTLVDAYLQQADWQFEAYQLRLEEDNYLRLMNMLDLYGQALNKVIERDGEDAPTLLPPLQGMLRTQYLISVYELPQMGTAFSGDLHVRHGQNQFALYQGRSYERGRTILSAIYDIEKSQHPDGPEPAESLTMLGDWYLWHNRQDAALEAYTAALAELNRQGDAQQQIERLFGRPVALPDLDGLRPLPAAVEPAAGDVQLAFGVTERGRVVDLVRLDDNEAQDGAAFRLMRTLRKTIRPRFDAGQPVVTKNVVKAFDMH